MKSMKWEGIGSKNLFPHISIVCRLSHAREWPILQNWNRVC